jgi:hypothetical protein
VFDTRLQRIDITRSRSCVPTLLTVSLRLSSSPPEMHTTGGHFTAMPLLFKLSTHDSHANLEVRVLLWCTTFRLCTIIFPSTSFLIHRSLFTQTFDEPIAVAERSRARTVFARSNTAIVGSNPT